MLNRAHQLCNVDPQQRLSLIAKEFPYVSLLQVGLRQKADEIMQEVTGIKPTAHTGEGSETMHYPVITIKDTPTPPTPSGN